MGSRKQASTKTLESGRLRELLTESLALDVDGYLWYFTIWQAILQSKSSVLIG